MIVHAEHTGLLAGHMFGEEQRVLVALDDRVHLAVHKGASVEDPSDAYQPLSLPDEHPWERDEPLQIKVRHLVVQTELFCSDGEFILA